MSIENPYSAPTSDLTPDRVQEEIPTISEALSRGYDFSIEGVLSEALGKLNGSKGTIIGAAFVTLFLITIVASLLITITIPLVKSSFVSGIVINIFFNFVIILVTYPLLAGLFLIGIRRAADYPIRFTMIFLFFNRMFALLLNAILINIIVIFSVGLFLGLGFALAAAGLPKAILYLFVVLAVVFGVYLSIAYMLSIPLITERGLSTWQAMETSRKAISQHWFKVFALMVVCYLLFVLSAFTLFIALIWVLPLIIVAFGVLYRTIFGVIPPANNN